MYTQLGIGIRLIVSLFLFLFLTFRRGEIHTQYNGLVYRIAGLLLIFSLMRSLMRIQFRFHSSQVSPPQLILAFNIWRKLCL